MALYLFIFFLGFFAGAWLVIWRYSIYDRESQEIKDTDYRIRKISDNLTPMEWDEMKRLFLIPDKKDAKVHD